MRLYNKKNAGRIDDPHFGSYEPDANGGFEMPDGLYAKLHGRPDWENDAERDRRLAAEQRDVSRDPATLLEEVRNLGSNQGAMIALLAKALGIDPSALAGAAPVQSATADEEPGDPAPAKPSRARKSSGSSAASE